MPPDLTIVTMVLVGGLFFTLALLYASVGHAGASGYLAVMALLGLAPEHMKPIALLLNLTVAGIATGRYLRAGCFSWPQFWPFALTSIPMAFVGGTVALAGAGYRVLVGISLLVAAVQLVRRRRDSTALAVTPKMIAKKKSVHWAAVSLGRCGGIIGRTAHGQIGQEFIGARQHRTALGLVGNFLAYPLRAQDASALQDGQVFRGR